MFGISHVICNNSNWNTSKLIEKWFSNKIINKFQSLCAYGTGENMYNIFIYNENSGQRICCYVFRSILNISCVRANYERKKQQEKQIISINCELCVCWCLFYCLQKRKTIIWKLVRLEYDDEEIFGSQIMTK